MWNRLELTCSCGKTTEHHRQTAAKALNSCIPLLISAQTSKGHHKRRNNHCSAVITVYSQLKIVGKRFQTKQSKNTSAHFTPKKWFKKINCGCSNICSHTLVQKCKVQAECCLGHRNRFILLWLMICLDFSAHFKGVVRILKDWRLSQVLKSFTIVKLFWSKTNIKCNTPVMIYGAHIFDHPLFPVNRTKITFRFSFFIWL